MAVFAMVQSAVQAVAQAITGGGTAPGSGGDGGGNGGGSELSNGVPVAVSNDGTQGDLVYTYTLPAGATNHVVTLSDGGDGFTGSNPGLYLRFGAEPLLPGEGATWTCRAIDGLPETCDSSVHGNNSEGTWYVKLPQNTFSGLELVASWT